jgi:protein CpxP
MIKLADKCVSKFATAVLFGGLSLAVSGCTPGNIVDGSASTTMKSQEAQGRVETRLETLHAKLQITAAQETKWEAVASVIRSNEAAVHELAEKRHATENATAVEDLKSYRDITDAHAAGLAKLIPVFEDLYNTMSDKQKANADKIFGKYEGHRGHEEHKHHMKKAADKAAQ